MGEEEFIQMYHKYNKRLIALAYTRLQDHHLAEDVAHDVLLKARQRIPDDIESTWAWLAVVARNRCEDVRRKRREVLDDSVAESTSIEGTESLVLRRLENQRLKAAIGQLPVRHRESIELAYLDQLSYEEIGRIQGVARTSVRDRLHYAKDLLRPKLSDLKALLPPMIGKRWWTMKWSRRAMQVAIVSTASVAMVSVGPIAHPPTLPDEVIASFDKELVPSRHGPFGTRIGLNQGANTWQHSASLNQTSEGQQVLPPLSIPQQRGEEAGGSGGNIGPVSLHCDDGDGPLLPLIGLVCNSLGE